MTTGVVTFDPVAFAQRFPNFAAVSPTLLGDYFTEATMIVDNTTASRVQQVEHRTVLLNLLTAHLTQIYQGPKGDGKGTGLVGRVSQASEGSVSVTSDMGVVPFSAAWFQQTPYGAQFWAMTARWRQMRYIPGAPRPAPGPRFWGQGYLVP